jgi:hypothetical protein
MYAVYFLQTYAKWFQLQVIYARLGNTARKEVQPVLIALQGPSWTQLVQPRSLNVSSVHKDIIVTGTETRQSTVNVTRAITVLQAWILQTQQKTYVAKVI